VVVCPSCGQENPKGFRFCGACATPLAAEEPAGVRKTVTVLFCDLVGSTSMGDRSDPELLREAMGRYHFELRTILERHGGTVEKFIGDAAMAVFGIPKVHEDDALRAVRAADEIRGAVGRLNLQVRIGINTGCHRRPWRNARYGRCGQRRCTPRASRRARAGLDRCVDRAPRPHWSPGRARRTARGERVSGERYGLSPARAAGGDPGLQPPDRCSLVGREDDLEALKRALVRAVDERSPQLATIVGPPGIGKSRLARELTQRSDARTLVGRCLSYGQGITYWPLAEVVSQVGDLRSVLGDDAEAELAGVHRRRFSRSRSLSRSSTARRWGFSSLPGATRPLLPESRCPTAFSGSTGSNPVCAFLTCPLGA
jgi:hypothetical protein